MSGIGNNKAPMPDGPAIIMINKLARIWAERREAEAATMLIRREPTEEEVDRAMIIGKWFFGWRMKPGHVLSASPISTGIKRFVHFVNGSQCWRARLRGWRIRGMT